MDTQTTDKVIARIQKLFARSARAGEHRGGATEAEAETAMRLAQELMAKYNLDVAAVEAAARPDAAASGAQRTKEEVSSRTRYEWQRQIAKYVAEAHFCYHLVRTDGEWRYVRDGKDVSREDALENGYDDSKWRKRATHVFVGRKANVVTAQLMFHYLVDAVEDLAPTVDNRVRVGRTGWGSYKGEDYRIKIVDGPTGPRFQRCDAHDASTVYDTISEAAAAITGKTANGYVFFNLGEASTAESWKKGCADRLCERLAKRRRDLIAEHDARVRQAEEDARAERERRAAEAKAASERVLGANDQAEAEAQVGAARASARRAAPAPTGLDAERPPEGDADWTPGQGAEAAEEPPATTALVLASVYDASEQEANYELAHGLEPGALARRRRKQEEREREYEAKQAAREAAGEAQAREEPVRVETEKQRLRRKAKEAEEMAKRRKRWARENEREARKAARAYAKVDQSAYSEGQEKGEGIGLDAQVGEASETKRIGGGK
ncbi:MAG: DUF2786 domain-containing protein [Chloroflexota bacterium]|nr:DUF2786 domain-containing protein [Chloroflexota bacterium]